jgi:hypothetical protein
MTDDDTTPAPEALAFFATATATVTPAAAEPEEGSA